MTDCFCEVCQSGAAVPIQEWRKLNPVHEQVYQEMLAASERGEVYPKGAEDEDSSSV